MSPHHRPRRRLAVLASAAVLGLTACGQDDEVSGGTVGPNEAVSEDLKVLQVQIEFPLDGLHDEGDDARLFLAVTNTGREDDELVAVTGPDFADAALTVDGAAASIPVPANDNVYVGAEGAPAIVLEDLSTALRSSQSIPVTLEFEEAGEVTVEAMVAAEGQTPAPTYDFPDPAEDPTPDN
jgi:periplasmic copper chaperone A